MKNFINVIQLVVIFAWTTLAFMLGIGVGQELQEKKRAEEGFKSAAELFKMFQEQMEG